MGHLALLPMIGLGGGVTINVREAGLIIKLFMNSSKYADGYIVRVTQPRARAWTRPAHPV